MASSKVVKEATPITVKDDTTQIINPLAKRKMVDEIEAKMNKQTGKAIRRVFTKLPFWSFVVVGAVGVIFESAELQKIPNSQDSPLALNHDVLDVFQGYSIILMVLALCNLAIHVKRISDAVRKSQKTKVLANRMKITANQAEVGSLRSAVEELNQEYDKKQETVKAAKTFLDFVTTYFVSWIGFCAAALWVSERFLHLKDRDDIVLVFFLVPNVTLIVILSLLSIIV